MRKFRRGFRSRRSSQPGRTTTGRQKVWVPKLFSSIPVVLQPNNDFADLFELVSPEDYSENFDTGSLPRRNDTCTIVRTVGRLLPDLVIGAPGANGIQWASAIFVRSRSAVLREFQADVSLFYLHTLAAFSVTTTFEENMTRLQPLQWVPDRSYSGAFRPNPGGTCSEFFADINRPHDMVWDFDVRQRRRMKGDEALYMLVSGNIVCDQDGGAARTDCVARTLIHDD